MITDGDLYRENQLLRRKLRAFLTQARENEQKMRRFHEQELRLISTPSLSELVQRVLYNYRTAFTLDVVGLTLHDPGYEIQRILEDEGVRVAEFTSLHFSAETDALDTLFGVSLEPRLGVFRPHEHAALFPDNCHAQSIALLPLVRYGELIGSLNLGSNDPQRFVAGSATDFLQRLATIVAICLENATNHERLKRVGLTDSLTGVNNRRFFDQRLDEEVARAQRSGEPLACLFLDIDHFKRINDQHGHRVGDRVLREVAGMIREQLRSTDVLGRYGGEEFSALLVNAEKEKALEIAERIRGVIAARRFSLEDGGTLSATISIGVSSLPATVEGNEDIAEELLDRADQALYLAKSSGRNRVIPAEEGRNAQVTELKLGVQMA
ncbi:MAG TPA: sensor domain-containing diguanylate cyclase [Gammaproteobacteria bacterium]|nr:sensor domain-containing diguanylate cyclase [Gammaproteobacteria bacterium]